MKSLTTRTTISFLHCVVFFSFFENLHSLFIFSEFSPTLILIKNGFHWNLGKAFSLKPIERCCDFALCLFFSQKKGQTNFHFHEIHVQPLVTISGDSTQLCLKNVTLVIFASWHSIFMICLHFFWMIVFMRLR